MHPGYKLEHFRKVGWPDEWISVTETMIRDKWETYYKPHAPPPPVNVEPVEPVAPTPSACAGSGRHSAQAAAANMRRMFSEAISSEAGHTRGMADPLDAYLKSPVVSNVSDPLEYWNARLASPSDAPLAHFALDYLSVPATSTDAERAFSCGRLTVSRLRHSLADASVRANTVLGSWARIPGLVSEADLVNNIKGLGGNPPGPGHDGQGAASSSKSAAVKKTGTTTARTASASTSGTSGIAKKASGSKTQSGSKTSSKSTKKDAKGKSRAEPEVFEVDSESE